MDVLKAEIERKKRQLQESKVLQSDKKYFKRGDLSAKYEADYAAKYGRHVDNEKKAETTTAGLSEDDVSSLPSLSRKEVVRRLRDRCEPVLLFAETEMDAYKRLRRLEILEPEVNKGLRNDFQEAMERVDQAYLDELMKSQAEDEDGTQSSDVKVHAENTSYEEIQLEAEELGKGDHDKDSIIILRFLQFVLQRWGEQLNKRSEKEKMSVRGKLSSATFTQTQSYVKPLFKKLRKCKLQEDILESLTIIIRGMLDRNYVEANDAYLQMAIGNAPWPIGVTMVGIHARTGREKIFSKHIAHVMNDESQRKYIQGLKRLMTKCQQLFPTDPSRSVEYGAMSTL